MVSPTKAKSTNSIIHPFVVGTATLLPRMHSFNIIVKRLPLFAICFVVFWGGYLSY